MKAAEAQNNPDSDGQVCANWPGTSPRAHLHTPKPSDPDDLPDWTKQMAFAQRGAGLFRIYARDSGGRANRRPEARRTDAGFAGAQSAEQVPGDCQEAHGDRTGQPQPAESHPTGRRRPGRRSGQHRFSDDHRRSRHEPGKEPAAGAHLRAAHPGTGGRQPQPADITPASGKRKEPNSPAGPAGWPAWCMASRLAMDYRTAICGWR